MPILYSLRPYILITVIVLGIQQPAANSAVSQPLQETDKNAPRIRHGQASWYSKKSPGIRKRTANNEIFNDQALTAAMWGVPFNQRVKVTNIDNGKSVTVRINDRGPHKRYCRNGRIIDLTQVAFTRLAHPKKGLVNVQVELLAENIQ